jgi:hypothetical protein
MNRILRHEDKSAVEYRLPIDVKDLPSGTELPRRFRILTESDPAKWLERIYSTLVPRSFRTLSDAFLKFTPISLVLACDESWYVRCCFDDPENYSGNIYLPRGQRYEIVRDLVESVNMSRLFEFVQSFGGLRESLPPGSGNFIYDKFTLFSDHPVAETFDTSEEYEEWEDALCLFYASNGDILLLSQDWQTGWFRLTQQVIEIYSDSFGQFVRQYAVFVKTYSDPFDSFSAFSPVKPRTLKKKKRR